MSEMKPCPFCGGKAITSAFFDLDDLEYMAFEVNDCDAEVTCENERCINGWWLSQKDWNTRPIEDALTARIAELEALVEGHDPFEDFPPKERGFDCSVMVLGKFEYEDEFTPFTNWDLCVYWFDEERWHPLNGYVKGDDIVRWYALPYKERER